MTATYSLFLRRAAVVSVRDCSVSHLLQRAAIATTSILDDLTKILGESVADCRQFDVLGGEALRVMRCPPDICRVIDLCVDDSSMSQQS